jgi:hypothetical protein
MQIAVLFLSLTVLLSWYFPILDFYWLLPADMYSYPRKTMTNMQYTAASIAVRWVVPAVAVAIFMRMSGLSSRVRSGLGTKLLYIAIAIYIGQWTLLLLASFVPGGGGVFALSTLFGLLAFPLKVVLLVGVVHVLINLEPKRVA